jgi:hypothetical protein
MREALCRSATGSGRPTISSRVSRVGEVSDLPLHPFFQLSTTISLEYWSKSSQSAYTRETEKGAQWIFTDFTDVTDCRSRWDIGTNVPRCPVCPTFAKQPVPTTKESDAMTSLYADPCFDPRFDPSRWYSEMTWAQTSVETGSELRHPPHAIFIKQGGLDLLGWPP